LEPSNIEVNTMKKHKWFLIAIIFAVALIFFSAGYIGLSGSEDEVELPVRTRRKRVAPRVPRITLAGTVDLRGRLIDDQGTAFELAVTDESLEVKALVGRRVSITGAVMEKEGRKIVAVHEYEILN
jgi:hypothetical protein